MLKLSLHILALRFRKFPNNPGIFLRAYLSRTINFSVDGQLRQLMTEWLWCAGPGLGASAGAGADQGAGPGVR